MRTITQDYGHELFFVLCASVNSLLFAERQLQFHSVSASVYAGLSARSKLGNTEARVAKFEELK